jgi:spore maturation protein CgeB
MLRIGVVGPIGEDTFADNVGESLRRMGHNVIYLGAANPTHGNRAVSRATELLLLLAPIAENQWQTRIVRTAVSHGCDLVVSVDKTLSPTTVAALKARGMRVVLWFPDAVINMGDQRMLLCQYDAIFMTDPVLVARLRAMLGLPVHYLPEACNPAWHRPIGVAGSDRSIVVVGSMYPSRSVLLDRLLDDGVPMRLYGGPFPRSNRNKRLRSIHSGLYVTRENKARIFRSAAGVLNNLHPGEMGVNCRLFEAAASGAAVLCEFRDVLSDVYDLDSEVLAFAGYAELMDKIRALLDGVGLSERIGDAAAARSLRDHTYEHRLGCVLDVVGI